MTASLTARTVLLIELTLAIGGFGIGTGEFAAMGLLPEMARSLDISVPKAGHVISAYALGVVVGAPVIAVLSAKLRRGTLLFGLMVVFALGNLASAAARDYPMLMLLRFLSGLPHGAYFGIASLVAAKIAGPEKRARAIGRVMLGLTVATLIGTPLATGFGQELGWRATFAGVGVIGAITAVMIRLYVPNDPPLRNASPLRELGALKRRQVWLTLGIAAAGSGGMFAVYSYISPLLTQCSGMPEHWVPAVLSVFGAGMILGNIVGSRLADKALMTTVGVTLVWDALVLALVPVMAGSIWLMTLEALLIGTAFVLGPALQTRLIDVAADAQTLAAALNHSAFNIANALGAWLGGLAISAGYGWTSTGWVGAGLSLAGLVVFAVSVATDPLLHRPAAKAAG